jgi:hypothetical protein
MQKAAARLFALLLYPVFGSALPQTGAQNEQGKSLELHFFS